VEDPISRKWVARGGSGWYGFEWAKYSSGNQMILIIIGAVQDPIVVTLATAGKVTAGGTRPANNDSC
jgi:hypothetical protein